jgi:surface polysaccharide O-acyltransferase-like enzyme
LVPYFMLFGYMDSTVSSNNSKAFLLICVPVTQRFTHVLSYLVLFMPILPLSPRQDSTTFHSLQ